MLESRSIPEAQGAVFLVFQQRFHRQRWFILNLRHHLRTYSQQAWGGVYALAET